MTYKSLQQLRDESKSHTDRASQLFQEAIKIFRLMQATASFEDYAKLQKEWRQKEAEAREEVRKSSDSFSRFISELERFKNHKLN